MLRWAGIDVSRPSRTNVVRTAFSSGSSGARGAAPPPRRPARPPELLGVQHQGVPVPVHQPGAGQPPGRERDVLEREIGGPGDVLEGPGTEREGGDDLEPGGVGEQPHDRPHIDRPRVHSPTAKPERHRFSGPGGFHSRFGVHDIRPGLSEDMRLAHVLADQADSISLERFRAQDLKVDTKLDLTPVTDADRAVEEMLRITLSRARTRDAVMGEEFGTTGHGPRRWVLDPIDGTKNFVRGAPVWATLIALFDGDEPVVGLVSAPALNRRWWAAKDVGA